MIAGCVDVTLTGRNSEIGGRQILLQRANNTNHRFTNVRFVHHGQTWFEMIQSERDESVAPRFHRGTARLALQGDTVDDRELVTDGRGTQLVTLRPVRLRSSHRSPRRRFPRPFMPELRRYMAITAHTNASKYFIRKRPNLRDGTGCPSFRHRATARPRRTGRSHSSWRHSCTVPLRRREGKRNT